MKENLNNLINYGELSRLISGSRSSITRKRISKKHRVKIDELKRLISEWIKSNT